MADENISQESILTNIDEKRNYFVKEIEQNELTSKKHKEVCTTQTYIKDFLILTSTIFGCISIFAFAYLVGIPIVISTATGLQICAITGGMEKEAWKNSIPTIN